MKTEVPFKMTAAQMIAHAQRGGWVECEGGTQYRLSWDPLREELRAGGMKLEKVAEYGCRPCECDQCKENAK